MKFLTEKFYGKLKWSSNFLDSDFLDYEFWHMEFFQAHDHRAKLISTPSNLVLQQHYSNFGPQPRKIKDFLSEILRSSFPSFIWYKDMYMD